MVGTVEVFDAAMDMIVREKAPVWLPKKLAEASVDISLFTA
jgi:hypothetical protein